MRTMRMGTGVVAGALTSGRVSRVAVTSVLLSRMVCAGRLSVGLRIWGLPRGFVLTMRSSLVVVAVGYRTRYLFGLTRMGWHMLGIWDCFMRCKICVYYTCGDMDRQN